MENRRAIESRQQGLHAELVAARQARLTSLVVLTSLGMLTLLVMPQHMSAHVTIISSC